VAGVRHRTTHHRHIGSSVRLLYWVSAMTKQELLKILRLLSALESASLVSKISLPDYLYEQLTDATEVLEREILK
jgi:hypothetical protein